MDSTIIFGIFDLLQYKIIKEKLKFRKKIDQEIDLLCPIRSDVVQILEQEGYTIKMIEIRGPVWVYQVW